MPFIMAFFTKKQITSKITWLYRHLWYNNHVGSLWFYLLECMFSK